MLRLSEIKEIINVSGLNAQLRFDCKDKWSEILQREYNVPSFYLENEVDYQTAVFKYLSESSTDISVILYYDGSPCGVWPLVFDIRDKEPIKSINNQYGGIVLPPLFTQNFPKKSERKVIKSCIEFLNNLLKVNRGECWRTNDALLDGNVSQWYQISLEKGAMLDKVCYEMHLELSKPIDEIRKYIRKSYRPLISSGQKKWTVSVMDKYCEDTWNKFIILHKTVAGRVTRSINTWNIQHKAIKDGNAFLVYILNSEGAMVGGGFFVMSSYQCHYSVGSYDKRLSDQPLGHMIQYQAILTMKEKGIKTYYMGDRFYSENLPFVNKKQVDISHFKQGFSSKIFPRIGLIFQSQETKKSFKKIKKS